MTLLFSAPVATYSKTHVCIFPGIETFGKNAVVCGRSKNVGMPIAMLLHGDGIRPDGEPFSQLAKHSRGKKCIKEIFT